METANKNQKERAEILGTHHEKKGLENLTLTRCEGKRSKVKLSKMMAEQ